MTLSPSLVPGRCWVWLPYTGVGKPDTIYVAHTKLTILDT